MISQCKNVVFFYDADGVRKEKIVGTTVTKYYTEGNRIHKEIRGNDTLWYYYDQTGVAGFNYNGIDYYYQKNIQGDIIRILDNTGTVVARYAYDAWGNHNVYDASGVENTSVTFIGNINPFRYRGYYYDTETGLYYLNSRYYDPEIKRFINSDDIRVISETGLNVNGQNLFVYCNNNPVMLKDPSGQIAITTILLWVLLGASLALSIYGVICAYNEYMRHPTTANLIALILEGVFLVLDIVSIIATVVTVVKAAKALSAIDVSGISKMPASDGITKGIGKVSDNDIIKAGIKHLDAGDVYVYYSTNDNYYGITNNVKRRAIEHKNRSGRLIEAFTEEYSFTRKHARILEQSLIDNAKARGIDLSNQINSIRKGTKLYQEYLQFISLL